MTQRFVYFIKPVGLPGPIKIGVANDVARRLQALSCLSPVPLEVMATIQGDHRTEAGLHQRFTAHRSHGEWFHPHPDLLDFIANPGPVEVQEYNSLTLAHWMRLNGKTQQQFARDMASAGYPITQGRVSQILREGTNALPTALAIERLTGGAVTVASLVQKPRAAA